MLNFVKSLLFFFILSIFSNTVFAETILPSEMKKLESGEILSKSITKTLKRPLRGAEGRVLIKASPEEVWKGLDNQKELYKSMPKVKNIAVLEKGENSQKIQTAVKIAPFLPAFKYTLYLDQSEKYRRIKFKRLEGCFKDLYGEFNLEPHSKNSTVLTYRLIFDTGIPLPASLSGSGLKQDLPTFLKGIKLKIEQDSKS